jgi:hypothetical protein
VHSALMFCLLTLALMGALCLSFLARYIWLLCEKESDERAERREREEAVDHTQPLMDAIYAEENGHEHG